MQFKDIMKEMDKNIVDNTNKINPFKDKNELEKIRRDLKEKEDFQSYLYIPNDNLRWN